MATRSGVRRTEPDERTDEHDHAFTAEVEHLSGWSSEELDALLTELIVPDHWNGKPCGALLEAIRCRIVASNQTYKDLFPPVFDALKLKMPSRLTGMLAKVQRRVLQAQTSGNLMILAEEVPGLAVSKTPENEIGPHCKQIGITPTLLLEGSSYTPSAVSVTNAVVIELLRYREKMNATWQVVTDVWWPNIFHTNTPLGTIESSWKNVNKKRQSLRKEELSEFLSSIYTVPVPKPQRQDEESDDEGYDDDSDLEFYPDFISEETFNHMGDCMEYLTDLLQEEVLQHDESNRDRVKVEKALEHANQINKELKKQVSTLQRRNVVRRLERREQELEDSHKENQKLNKRIQQLEKKIKTLQKDKKRKGDSRIHFKKSAEKSKSAQKELKKQVQLLELENDDLKCQLDHIMEDKEIVSFEGGKYTNDIRLVCFELIARGVSSNNVSDIIRIVLRDVGKMNVGRLPKPTLIRYLSIEQAMLSKESARAKIEASDHVTLQVDGTTKKRKGYTTFMASTDDGTVGMCLHDIHTESAESLLQETEETLDELNTLNINKDQGHTLQLLAKIKNTMTDRCIVNKAYIEKLEKWRAKALPQVTENWEDIDDDVKQQMLTINDMYCGKHLVLNLQEYAASALFEWEIIEAGENKLGREKKVLWSRGKESATLLTVRSFCNLLGPECDEKSGMVEDFKSILTTHHNQSKSHLQSYRGNRFNVPFHNSAATYHHKQHFSTLVASLDQKREENMFIKCLKLDLQDDIILAGMRAMGIICEHITTPLMQMIESDLHILDTDKFYTRLHQKVLDWMIDPSPLVNDSTILFPEFPPVRNELHHSLYETTSGNIEHLTKQALSVIMHNLHVCIIRQLQDHLPEGKFYNAEHLREETTSCPKDNLAPERMFAGLDYLRRKMPNANTVAFEGILLWSLNKTRKYLDDMTDSQRSRYIEDARKNRPSFLRLYQQKSARIKSTLAEKLRMSREKKEARQRQQTKQAAENTANALKLCGFLCNSAQDVDRLKADLKGKKLEAALISQIKHWKSSNKGGIRKDLFYLTNKGKHLTAEQLENNLKNIILQVMTTVESLEEQPGSSNSSETPGNKDQQKSELKRRLLAKLSPTKRRRKGPFPSDRIIGKRIRHMFIDSEGGGMLECKALVLRKATEEDIDELVEQDDRKHIGVYTFYTIMYEPPHEEMLCYPLEKEWDEGTLDLM
ncbi:uncharacterized protein [Amphiura filiformis]|uniref:uncharacterized protein n=1 Tax=Amphiura filiformis TaxID=82378 RepID=UPI003B224709